MQTVVISSISASCMHIPVPNLSLEVSFVYIEIDCVGSEDFFDQSSTEE